METTTRFIYEQHDDFGTWGWRVENQPDFDPLASFGLAHDMMEHFPDDDGDISGECEAMGAMLWIRGVGHWWDRYTNGISTPAQILGDSIVNELWRAYHDNGFPFNNVLESCEMAEDGLDYDVDQWIVSAKEIALNTFISEFGEFGDYEEQLKAFKPFLDKIIPWITRGVNRASERYDPSMAADTFELIVQAIKKLPSGEEYGGMEMEVTWDDERVMASVQMLEEEYA